MAASIVRREIRRVLIALGYFTRVPIPAWVGWSALELNRSARYFPLIGAGIGAVAALVLCGASSVLPPALAVVLSMAASALLTGAFHEDGLADAADGFGGAQEPDRVLDIMRDSRIGSFGAIALVLVLLAKFAALTALLERGAEPVAAILVIAHAASRSAALGIMATLPYLRTQGASKARPVAEGIGTVEWGAGLSLGLAPLVLAVALDLLALSSAALALTAGALVMVLAGRYFRRRIGGYTGDCLGAAQQLSEVAIYIAFCARLA